MKREELEMKKELTRLQKIVSTTFLIGIGLTGSLFFAWLIKLLLIAIF